MKETTSEKSTDAVFTHPPNTLHGNLIFDHGFPAAGVTVRLYNIGFGGQDTKLGEVNSDAQGAYSFSYWPAGTTPAGAPNSDELRTVPNRATPQSDLEVT
ncbi:MAG: hypothetical protein NTAFB01_24480 [Nitrospira sp.]